MTQQLFEKLFVDKGYLSKALWDVFFGDGIQLFTKLRLNRTQVNIINPNKMVGVLD